MTEKNKLAIQKYLNKHKESVIVDIAIKDYNKSNFYIALVFNSKIEKFKVLYIPLDVVTKNIEYYVCYQFINITLVNYILETIHKAKDIYKKTAFRDKTNKNISSYYIEINTYIAGENYTFKTTKYIPKEWTFLYEVIVILFEHTPTIMHELCSDILAVIDNRTDNIDYQVSLDFDLFKDDLTTQFGSSKPLKISYLEKINGMYFSIIDDELVIADYIASKKVLNLYCSVPHNHNIDKNKINQYFSSIISSIRNGEFKKFYKIMVNDSGVENDDSNNKYYLCYGIRNDCFKVIESFAKSLLPINKYRDGMVKIIGENKEVLEGQIKGI